MLSVLGAVAERVDTDVAVMDGCCRTDGVVTATMTGDFEAHKNWNGDLANGSEAEDTETNWSYGKCKRLCKVDEDCVAFEFASNTGKCELHYAGISDTFKGSQQCRKSKCSLISARNMDWFANREVTSSKFEETTGCCRTEGAETRVLLGSSVDTYGKTFGVAKNSPALKDVAAHGRHTECAQKCLEHAAEANNIYSGTTCRGYEVQVDNQKSPVWDVFGLVGTKLNYYCALYDYPINGVKKGGECKNNICGSLKSWPKCPVGTWKFKQCNRTESLLNGGVKDCLLEEGEGQCNDNSDCKGALKCNQPTNKAVKASVITKGLATSGTVSGWVNPNPKLTPQEKENAIRDDTWMNQKLRFCGLNRGLEPIENQMMNSCCSSRDKCGAYEGHCTRHRDCRDDLMCARQSPTEGNAVSVCMPYGEYWMFEGGWSDDHDDGDGENAYYGDHGTKVIIGDGL